MRILITGSRDWDDRQLLEDILIGYDTLVGTGPMTLVSGACPTGADAMAESYAEYAEWTVERYPALWGLHGKRAGYVRNAEMVGLGADICLAFIKNNSRGASMTAKLAQRAGIETVVYEPHI